MFLLGSLAVSSSHWVVACWGISGWAVVVGVANGNEDAGLAYSLLFVPPSFLVGATVGAAAGATIMQRALRRGSSFRRALLGAVTRLLAGVLVIYCLWRFDVDMAAESWVAAIAGVSIPITAGAVLGSGWKAKPADLSTREGVPPALG